jgi:hypothetical protein
MVCYHSGNIRYAKMISDQIIDNPLVALLYADLTNSVPSNEIIHYFRQQTSGICWTEIEKEDKTGFVIHEFRDDDSSTSNSELNVIINELKAVGIDWQLRDNDLKQLFCGHTASRLALVLNIVLTLPTTIIQLTKTKATCHVCHEGMKQLSLIRQRDIILRDNERVHHFHNGQCSCHDQF